MAFFFSEDTHRHAHAGTHTQTRTHILLQTHVHVPQAIAVTACCFFAISFIIIRNADTKRIFLDFIHEPARRRLLVWPDEDDELHAGYDMPSEGRKKAIYFIKKRSFIDFYIDFQRVQARTLGALDASQRAFGRLWAILNASPNFAKF